jgi:hypothetical protein
MTLWNFTSLGLPSSKYSAIFAKSPPNKIPPKFHLLGKFPQNFICSGFGLGLNFRESCHVFGAQLNGTIQTQSGNLACWYG